MSQFPNQVKTIPKARLRRIALDRQGLLRTDHFGRGKAATLRAIEQLGYVQIDTISVVERAHHHVLWSRVGNYQPKFLEQLLRQGKIFEYWFHAASFLPMSEYRFALPRMMQLHGERGWFESCDKNLRKEILRRVEAEGPLRARDFEDPEHRGNGWWEWKPAKQALEQLFIEGELMICAREGFQKLYDLPQRVLPSWVDTSMPSLDDYAAHLIDTTLRAHGFSNPKSMTYLRKGKQLRESIKQQLEQRVMDGSLEKFEIGKRDSYYIEAGLLDQRAPRSQARLRILSPFDNAVIQRQRGREIFGFDYQIECYLPAAKRQFGYFCLPLLYRDQFVGRIDCKAHRSDNLLEIKSLYLESSVDERFTQALVAALRAFAEFNACDRIDIGYSRPEHYLPSIRAMLS